VERRRSALAVLALAAIVWGSTARAEVVADDPPPAATRPPAVAAGGEPTPEDLPEDREEVYDDPFEAYRDGAWQQALEGFLDLQVERPDDPRTSYDIGNVRYRIGDFAAADESFTAAAAAGDRTLRAEALYNLGNSAYRQGRLEEAVELYRRALEVDPDDIDAKFNLEFVRQEIRRRQEQQQQQQQQGGEGQPNDTSDQEDGQPPDPEGSDGERPPQKEDGESDQQQGPAQDPAEDEAGSESEPKGSQGKDSDGDGIPDGEEAGSPPPDGAPSLTGEPGEMTAEEAERFLQALEDRRPPLGGTAGRGRRVAGEKDW
jgi:Ca-activated chloride channel family protein